LSFGGENKVKIIESDKKLTINELPIGGIVEAGTAIKFKTGSWRSRRPIWNKEKCIHCLICWISCPDASIRITSDEKKITVITGIDYDHCKGCGICANECKIAAITMQSENK
jgi:pyruvate ferredoxin oxidoreductase delta subunit